MGYRLASCEARPVVKLIEIPQREHRKIRGAGHSLRILNGSRRAGWILTAGENDERGDHSSLT